MGYDMVNLEKKVNAALERASETFYLAERAEAALDEYCGLVRATLPVTATLGTNWVWWTYPRPEPHLAGFFLERWKHERHDGTLSLRNFQAMEALAPGWLAWTKMYACLYRRSPLLELRDYLAALSESINSSSWDSFVEEPLRDWIDDGAKMQDLPFEDRHSYLTREMAERLIVIRQSTGGWLYGYHKTVFLTDAQVAAAPQGIEKCTEYLDALIPLRPSFEGIR